MSIKYPRRWQWTAFLSAGSTAGYVYFYSFYYFFFKTKMYGFFQTTFYFGYMGVFSLGLGMLCGTVSEIFQKMNTSKYPIMCNYPVLSTSLSFRLAISGRASL